MFSAASWSTREAMILPRPMFFAALVSALCTGCSTLPPVSSFPDPHGHKTPVHLQKSSPYHVKDMTANDPNLLILKKPDSSTVVFNQAKNLAAVIATTPHQFYGYAVPVLVLLRDGKPYICFVSKTWPNRPFDGLAWLDNRLLTFDLMAGEDKGWHYIIDAEAGRAVFATPFNDADQ
jgi:hypothetical protein